jgi:hypothetical protein
MKEIKITVDKEYPPKNLTLNTAFQYAYLKWDDIVTNGGNDNAPAIRIPALKDFSAYCSYCEMFNKGYGICHGCPLEFIHKETGELINCFSGYHPYAIWQHNNHAKEKAKDVLQLIIDTNPNTRKKVSK